MSSSKRYEIRPMQAGDLDSAAEVLHAASRPRRFVQTPEAARRLLAGSLATDGGHNLVVVCDGDIVGYTCALRQRDRLAGCGPIAVHPEHVDAGLVSQMLMRTIGAALEQGVSLLRHPMALHKTIFNLVYGRMKLDFTGQTYIRLERKPESSVPLPGHHEARELSPADLERIVEFDRELFIKADRSRDFLLALEQLDGRGWALERDGELRGFVFNAPGLGIGPLAAVDPAAAIDALRVATGFDHAHGQNSHIHVNAADRELLEEALRMEYTCREPVLLFERSLDGTVASPMRGIYGLSPFGIP